MTGLFQIADSATPGLYLGAAGWTKHRPSALVFTSERSAGDWLESARLSTPSLITGRKFAIVPAPEPKDVPPGWAAESDFDPYEAAR